MAAVEPQFKIRESVGREEALPSDMYAAWARCLRINISWTVFENQTTILEQLSTEQFLRLDIRHVCHLSNGRAWNSFVANWKIFFLVLASVLCVFFGVANSFEARFVNVLAQRMFFRNATGASPEFKDVVNLRGVGLFAHNDGDLVCSHRIYRFVISLLGLSIGAYDMIVRMQEQESAS